MSIFYIKIVIVINNMIQRLSTATKLMGLKYSSGLFLKGNGSNPVMFINNKDVQGKRNCKCYPKESN